MEGLRFALLIAGVALVAGIYVFAYLARRRAAARTLAAAPDRHSIDGDYDIDVLGGVSAPLRETSEGEISVDVSVLSGMRASYESTMDEESVMSVGADAAQQPLIDMSRPIVVLMLLAKDRRLPGPAILDALDAEGFRPGPMQIYHWCFESTPPVAFGVADLVEPGALEPDSLPDMETPGLVMFMSVSNDAAHAKVTFDTMVAAARRLADRLDATLCDETRSTLTMQAENHLGEKVEDIARQGRFKD